MYNSRENNPEFGKRLYILISLEPSAKKKKTYQGQLIEQHFLTRAR